MFRKSFLAASVLLFVLAATPLSAADQSTSGSATIRTRDRGDWSSIVRIVKKAVRGVVKGNSDLLGGTKP